MKATVKGFHHRGLGAEEAFAPEAVNILPDGVVAHSDRSADGGVARITLEGFSVLAVHEVGEKRNFTCIEIESKHCFRHREIFPGDILSVRIVVSQPCNTLLVVFLLFIFVSYFYLLIFIKGKQKRPAQKTAESNPFTMYKSKNS